ncbi:MAG: hypothetical protein ACKO5F_13295 [Synechococcus sp.]
MRPHPIAPVTEPLQYRAIGVVRGVYEPEDPQQLTRGVLRTEDGAVLETVVLGRLLTLLRRHLDLEQPHLWVVYPRTRDEGSLHLQLVGVWEPSTLDPEAPPAEATEGDTGAAETSAGAPAPLDSLPEGDDYFSIRGELIFTKPENGDLVVKVRVLPKPDGNRPTPFKVQLKGEVPLEHLRHFVSLEVRRRGQELHVESLEVLAPVNQRGNRGGKGRRGNERGRGDRSGGERSGGGDRSGAPRGGRSEGSRGGAGLHSSAISRPSR